MSLNQFDQQEGYSKASHVQQKVISYGITIEMFEDLVWAAYRNLNVTQKSSLSTCSSPICFGIAFLLIELIFC